MFFGAHVSVSGGVFNAPLNAAKIGCEVFQMFTRSPQGGSVPELTPEIVELFKRNCEILGQREWYVHCPYFINFASAQPRIKYGSISVVRQELERGTILGAKYVMAHLGSYKDLGKENGYKQVIEGLGEMLGTYGHHGRDAIYRVSTDKTEKNEPAQFLIEISAGAGDVIGDMFEEIAEIIFHPKLEKYNIGVCFDTQHAFGSGYDLRTPEAVKKTFDTFDKIIGLEHLKMSHCNDSKVELGSHRDRHEHIGEGHIGRGGFEAIFAEKRLQHVNFVLETEPEKVREDLKILKDIRGKI